MRSRLEIRVLGALSASRDGRSLPLPASRKTRALLAYLAVVGRPARRDHLCELFWEIPDDPRASLRWSLHKIRKITNGDGLVADRSQVLLDPQAIDLDYTRVSRLQPGDIARLDTPALDSLVGAFAGEFLEDLCLPHCQKFEAWRLYQADFVKRIHVRILRALIERTREQPERNLFYAHLLNSFSPESDTPVRDDNTEGGSGVVPHDAGLHPVHAVTRARRVQEIRFCRSRDGVQIAYAVCGHGPPLVRAAHWMSHLEYDCESPVWRHWIAALSGMTTLIRYDQRGNGLSDRDVGNFSFEAMVDDLESVIEAAQLDRFTLLGVSQSCAVSAAYAARNPKRLSGLILYGGFVKGWRKRGDQHEIATHEAMTTLIREGWAMNTGAFRQLFTMMFIPNANAEQIAWFNELQRVTVSASNAGCLHEAFGEIDVSAHLPRIGVPTLVLHARQDLVVPFHAGREFATHIPGARFVSLDSTNHILLAEEPAFFTFCEEVTRFISESLA